LTPAVALAQTTRNQDDQTNTTSRPDIAEIRERAKARAEEARTSAEERKAEILQRTEERKAEVKADVCERRQLVLERIMPRLSQGATSVKSSIDTIYTRVAGFYESGQLTVENYDELVSEIEVAKANAEAAITAIDGQSFTLDCENPSAGQQLDGFRMAVREAKDSLKEYRKTVVELISSMRSAASTQNDSDTEETSDTDTNQNDTEGMSNE
jgi:hypothetical protein